MTKPALSSRERIGRMYEHAEADRIPVLDSPWEATLERWRREGLPDGADCHDVLDLDHITYLRADNSPRYPERILEETEEYTVSATSWGVTLKNWKHIAGTPEYIAFEIDSPDAWRKAKARMVPHIDRVNWAELKQNYPRWRERGDWLSAGFWFGFDITHSWAVGTERVLMAMVEDPEWIVDMFNTELDLHLALYGAVWDAGFTFDEIRWPDDMGYKLNQFFSLSAYRELLKPVQRRAVEWAHARGCKAHLHSCGDIRPFVPELVEIGMDALNPIEVKAGMDPLALKRQYGDRLLLHGGVNAALWDNPLAIAEEIRRVVPILKENGGYIFSSDHSVPSSVSWAAFQEITDLAKRIGSY